MYLTHVRHRVKDYAAWRKAFDANTPMLKKAGVLDTWIIPVDGDDTDIVVINTWPAKKNWDDFMALHEFEGENDIKKKMEDGGVIGQPQFWGGDVAA
jgi:hypothetical protein